MQRSLMTIPNLGPLSFPRLFSTKCNLSVEAHPGQRGQFRGGNSEWEPNGSIYGMALRVIMTKAKTIVGAELKGAESTHNGEIN